MIRVIAETFGNTWGNLLMETAIRDTLGSVHVTATIPVICVITLGMHFASVFQLNRWPLLPGDRELALHTNDDRCLSLFPHERTPFCRLRELYH
jgi:hypothetical protein